QGDTIDLTAIGFTAGASATLGSGNVLTVSGNGHKHSLNLAPGDDFTGSAFAVTNDGKGGTNITVTPGGAGPSILAALSFGQQQSGDPIITATPHSTIDIGGGDDTIVGFDQSADERLHLTVGTVSNALAHASATNGGKDTLMTLSDGSLILLKGVSHIDGSFFA